MRAFSPRSMQTCCDRSYAKGNAFCCFAEIFRAGARYPYRLISGRSPGFLTSSSCCCASDYRKSASRINTLSADLHAFRSLAHDAASNSAAIGTTSDRAVSAEHTEDRVKFGPSWEFLWELIGSFRLAKQEKWLGRIDASGRPIDIWQKLVVLAHT